MAEVGWHLEILHWMAAEGVIDWMHCEREVLEIVMVVGDAES